MYTLYTLSYYAVIVLPLNVYYGIIMLLLILKVYYVVIMHIIHVALLIIAI